MNASLAHRIGLWCIAALAAGTSLPSQALSVCAAPPLPESRASAFDARLFQHDGTDISASGRSQLSAYAQALESATLEVVVITVPVPVLTDTEMPRELAQQRAEALRQQLAQRGVPRERIYVEQRSTTLPPRVARDAPVVIETIAAWPRMAATGRGWRCVAEAGPSIRTPAATL
ncbi:OmpA family protein [Aquabacterium sp.]|uniref:OmpA family protein n=1 Tax=Aquabacterium sp. TaxID=1872578 RepID=UPI002CA32925|nr:OmpA family protein [Aquabacterium sp.]HSW04583.1 OmpA family protein [Aquabacterium sp.]